VSAMWEKSFFKRVARARTQESESVVVLIILVVTR
jgi:hypothetical protein